MSDTCFIFGAGPFYGLPVAPRDGDHIIAADGGLRHCLAERLTPELVLGDLDSLDRVPEALSSKLYPVEKDDTDTMLALKTGLARGYRRFHLYGGTGGRMDHTLANLQALAYLAQHGAQGWLYDERYVFTAIRDGGAIDLPRRDAGIFSVFCLGAEAHGVSITGAQYPLDRAAVSPWFPIGVSNHFIGQAPRITVEQGCLLVGWELA